MTVPVSALKVGKCYLTRETRVRRVTEIHPNGEVRYKYRSFPANPKKTWQAGALPPDIFAEFVLREVPCNWTPDTDEAAP